MERKEDEAHPEELNRVGRIVAVAAFDTATGRRAYTVTPDGRFAIPATVQGDVNPDHVNVLLWIRPNKLKQAVAAAETAGISNSWDVGPPACWHTEHI